MLDEVFARNPDGTPVTLHFRLTCDREDLTRLFTCCALGWLHLTDEQVLWSTSNPETAREAFSHLRSAIGRPELRRHVERIRAANGAQEIRLRHGPRLLVYAALTGHVHYLARDGEWCVTVTQVGMLWEHLRRAGERTP